MAGYTDKTKGESGKVAGDSDTFKKQIAQLNLTLGGVEKDNFSRVMRPPTGSSASGDRQQTDSVSSSEDSRMARLSRIARKGMKVHEQRKTEAKRLHEWEEQLKKREAEVEQQEAAINKLASYLGVSPDKIVKGIEDKLASLKTQETGLDNKIKSVDDEIERKRKEFEEDIREASLREEERLKKAKKSAITPQQELEKTRKELDETNEELEKAKKELEKVWGRTEEEIRIKEGVITSRAERLGKVAGELERTRQQLEEAKKELEEIEAKRKKSEEEWLENQRAREAAESLRDEAVDEYNEMVDELEEEGKPVKPKSLFSELRDGFNRWRRRKSIASKSKELGIEPPERETEEPVAEEPPKVEKPVEPVRAVEKVEEPPKVDDKPAVEDKPFEEVEDRVEPGPIGPRPAEEEPVEEAKASEEPDKKGRGIANWARGTIIALILAKLLTMVGGDKAPHEDADAHSPTVHQDWTGKPVDISKPIVDGFMVGEDATALAPSDSATPAPVVLPDQKTGTASKATGLLADVSWGAHPNVEARQTNEDGSYVYPSTKYSEGYSYYPSTALDDLSSKMSSDGSYHLEGRIVYLGVNDDRLNHFGQTGDAIPEFRMDEIQDLVNSGQKLRVAFEPLSGLSDFTNHSDYVERFVKQLGSIENPDGSPAEITIRFASECNEPNSPYYVNPDSNTQLTDLGDAFKVLHDATNNYQNVRLSYSPGIRPWFRADETGQENEAAQVVRRQLEAIGEGNIDFISGTFYSRNPGDSEGIKQFLNLYGKKYSIGIDELGCMTDKELIEALLVLDDFRRLDDGKGIEYINFFDHNGIESGKGMAVDWSMNPEKARIFQLMVKGKSPAQIQTELHGSR